MGTDYWEKETDAKKFIPEVVQNTFFFQNFKKIQEKVSNVLNLRLS